MPGVTGSPVSSARVPGLRSAPSSSPSRDPVGAAERQPVVEDRRRRAGGARHARTARTPARRSPGRCTASTGRSASRSPTRVPPPGALNTVRPSCASRAPERPVQVDHRSADRARRQQRLVAARRAASIAALGPAEPPGQLGVQRRRRRRRRSRGCRARPRPSGSSPRDLRGELDPAGRLVVPQPQPGRGAEVRRRRAGARRSRTARRPSARRRGERLAERGRERRQNDADRGDARARRPSRGGVAGALDQRPRVLGRAGRAGGLLGGRATSASSSSRPTLLRDTTPLAVPSCRRRSRSR